MRFTAPTHIMEALGYDHLGNNEKLLTEADKLAIENGEYQRVDQNAMCSCGAVYRLHPVVQGALWLHRACDKLVKL